MAEAGWGLWGIVELSGQGTWVERALRGLNCEIICIFNTQHFHRAPKLVKCICNDLGV